MTWRGSFLETSSALTAVIVADLLGSVVTLGYYYVIGIFSAITIGLLPAVIFAKRKKEGLLKWYKHAINRFSVWLSVILVANIFASAWTVFKLASTTDQLWAGPLAIGLFFVLVLLAKRIMTLLIPAEDARGSL